VPHILPEYSTGKESDIEKNMQLPNKHKHTTSNEPGISKQSFKNFDIHGSVNRG
jgi:hypothetical protein